jgi:hypothetical protein
MTIKLAVLTTGENIITDIKEGLYEDKVICYILENPCSIKVNGTYAINGEKQHSVSLSKWPTLSKDTTIEIIPDSIVTLVDPEDKLKQLYETQVLGNKSNGEYQNTDYIELRDSDK